MLLDLHKLRIFHTVAQSGSFSRAAERLHMTQPTVSQQLAVLEVQIGASLFDRDTRHVRLTPAGEALLPYAEKLLAMANEAIDVTQAAAGLAENTLRMGVGNMLATYFLPDLLSRYRTLYPHTRTRVSVGNTAELLGLLAANTIDIALVGSPADHPDITVRPFRRDRLVVIVAPGDEWEGRAGIHISELEQRTFLTREAGSALHSTVERLMGADIMRSENVILLGETEAIKRSVEAGLGVALIQEIAIGREIQAGTLRALPLLGADDRRTYLLAHPKRRKLTGAAEKLMKLLELPA